MSNLVYSDAADSLLATAIGAVDTVLTVQDGSRFAQPATGERQVVALIDGAALEIVHLISRAGAALTVERGMEGTTARQWAAGTRVRGVISAATMDQLLGGIDNTGNVGAGALDIQTSRTAPDIAASGSNAVAIGANCKASGSNALAIGQTATASGVYSVATGYMARATSDRCTAVGSYTNVTGENGVAMGWSAEAKGKQSVAIGDYANTNAQSDGAVAVGKGAYTTRAGGVAIGDTAEASDTNAVAVGAGAMATTLSSVAIGDGSGAHADYSVAIGYQAQSSSDQAVAIGYQASVSSPDSIALGSFSSAAGYCSAALASGTAYASWSLAVAGYTEADYTISVGMRSEALAMHSMALGVDRISDVATASNIGYVPLMAGIGNNAVEKSHNSVYFKGADVGGNCRNVASNVAIAGSHLWMSSGYTALTDNTTAVQGKVYVFPNQSRFDIGLICLVGGNVGVLGSGFYTFGNFFGDSTKTNFLGSFSIGLATFQLVPIDKARIAMPGVCGIWTPNRFSKHLYIRSSADPRYLFVINNISNIACFATGTTEPAWNYTTGSFTNETGVDAFGNQVTIQWMCIGKKPFSFMVPDRVDLLMTYDGGSGGYGTVHLGNESTQDAYAANVSADPGYTSPNYTFLPKVRRYTLGQSPCLEFTVTKATGGSERLIRPIIHGTVYRWE